MLTGYHLPDLPRSFFFALRLTSQDETMTDNSDRRRDAETGLLNKEAFAEFATQRIKDAEADGEDLKVTMLHLEDMGELRTRLDEEADQDLMRTLGRFFDDGAGNRDVAAKFDDENYGVSHADVFDIGGLRNRLETHLKGADPKGIGVRVNSSTAPADLKRVDPQDAVKAFLYTVNHYCADPSSELAIKSLGENLDNLLADTSAKMVEFKEMVSADSFNAVFQPVVGLPTQGIHHYEAIAVRRCEKHFLSPVQRALQPCLGRPGYRRSSRISCSFGLRKYFHRKRSSRGAGITACPKKTLPGRQSSSAASPGRQAAIFLP